ncbi:MAG: bifunctional (p)ppGpp synthetase/guanosine-3',5'-bis(diphosphate) 3'-pyrophosphohydrolase [Ardenticatenaceae bacterium]|nr:bifunctional (p)ppGpp synthetase/guanosine-3',5'-bis(diphosphate) 3'-pyrophosphohydrolase [Ardenticatenaceae bacterium]
MTQIKTATLTDLLTHWSDESAVTIRRAYQFAANAHGEHLHPCGDLYIDHDLAVANIMMGLDVDANTVAASLLHDVLLPHTGCVLTQIESAFNSEVNSLVLGLQNLYAYAEHQQYKDSRATSLQAGQQNLEAIRRAILSIIEGDIRVILIRMADCLQNLRRASHLSRPEQLEVAGEVMHIYAPLANRLGIWQLKWEMEDLAFRFLEPQRYREIASKLAERRAERSKKVETAAARLQKRIAEMGFAGVVTGRPKHIYSIYRKMQRKQVDIDRIYDIQALRVILDPLDPISYAKKSNKEKEDEDRSLCYQVLGAVHSLWQPIPREFDDYIASPKPNGYKSLHTAVIDTHTGQTLEVQIRTSRMHEEAEKGVAAHWAYKEGEARVSASAQRRIQVLRELLTAIQDSGDTAVDSSALENEIQAEAIYVFTPNGDVKELPAGATPIDFAYLVHTQVGHRCRGARVNGKMVSLDYRLKSGDKVEIITAKRASPSRDWMNPSLGYTGSARTRSKIRQWFREQEREQNIEQGREVVVRELKRLGLGDTYSIEDIAEALKFSDVDKFLAKVGFGDVQTTQISGALALMRRELKPDDELRPLLQSQPKKPSGLTVRGLSGLHTKMAKCCNPIPPEPILGYITRGEGVTIHRKDCKQLALINEPERLIEVDWGFESETFPIPIVVRAYRRPGLVDEMNSILRGQNINVPKTKRTTDDSMTTVYLIVEVTDLEQLNWLMKKFENLPNVTEVYRERWN